MALDEFGLIKTYLAPLAGPTAFRLQDDVAAFQDGIITKDLLVEGVHFRTEDPLDRVAQKALRVNVSDIVAKGCVPTHYLLGLVWRAGTSPDDVGAFAKGLAADQKAYGIELLGGDTTRTPSSAPMVISVTMTGRPSATGPVLRAGARPGDLVLVTGTIGDSGLGLKALLGDIPLSDELESAYQLPTPPAALAPFIAQYASAALDVSDGLIADAEHLACASGVGVRLVAADIPLSKDGRAYATSGERLGDLLSFGDDYQTLCTVAPADAEAFQQKAAEVGVQLTTIGMVEEGRDVRVVDETGAALMLDRKGYQHF